MTDKDLWGKLDNISNTDEYKDRLHQHAINWLLLENYLIARNPISTPEYTIRFIDDKNFIIHPTGQDGNTIDFKLINSKP